MEEQIDPIALRENFIGPPIDDVQPALQTPVRIPSRKKRITTLTLTSDTCKWPFGDPTAPDFHYCGQLPQTDRPYCDTHDAMSRPPSQRRRAS
jgi:GcrA cell cycle regulator